MKTEVQDEIRRSYPKIAAEAMVLFFSQKIDEAVNAANGLFKTEVVTMPDGGQKQVPIGPAVSQRLREIAERHGYSSE
jgi:hypothetical protein